MDINKLNKVALEGNGLLKRMSELKIGQLYRIESIQKTKTTYGDKVTVNLEDGSFTFLPSHVSKELLDNAEAGLQDFQEKLTSNSISFRRFQPLGKLNPIEFVISLPQEKSK